SDQGKIAKISNKTADMSKQMLGQFFGWVEILKCLEWIENNTNLKIEDSLRSRLTEDDIKKGPLCNDKILNENDIKSLVNSIREKSEETMDIDYENAIICKEYITLMNYARKMINYWPKETDLFETDYIISYRLFCESYRGRDNTVATIYNHIKLLHMFF